MKTKDKILETGDFWYDLFEGGYIDPYKFLENKEDADRVLAAISTLNNFRSSLERDDRINYL